MRVLALALTRGGNAFCRCFPLILIELRVSPGDDHCAGAHQRRRAVQGGWCRRRPPGVAIDCRWQGAVRNVYDRPPLRASCFGP
eukprot:7088163-Alexandrium_andersonii.AAC.1